MASTSAVSMAVPLSKVITQKQVIISTGFFKPLNVKPSRAITASKSNGSIKVEATSSSLKEKAVTGLTAVAVTTNLLIPQIAEAADSGFSPSLKNFLLSIAAGGVVLVAIIGAVVGVSNFDPVKRISVYQRPPSLIAGHSLNLQSSKVNTYY